MYSKKGPFQNIFNKKKLVLYQVRVAPEYYRQNTSKDHDWAHVFASAIHYLWRARSEELFELKTPSDEELFLCFWAVYNSQQLGGDKLAVVDGSHDESLHHVSWLFPDEWWVKLNCDGSVLHSSKASCGGLIRNALGECLAGFAANLGSCPITVAEIWGDFYALEMGWNKGFRAIILELDSSSAIKLIQGGVDNKNPYSSVINRVREHFFMQTSWHVRLQDPIYRESNRAADFMASLGHSLQIEVYFYLLPSEGVGTILRKDIAGVSFPRLWLSWAFALYFTKKEKKKKKNHTSSL